MAGKSLKLTDVVGAFKGDEDAAEWWARFDAVADLKSYSDEEKVLSVPLLLRGPAFTLYNELSVEKRRDLQAVKSAILTAFSLSKFAAFDELKQRRYQPGENVDVYFAELKRLCHLAGMDCPGVAFVTGLPEHVGLQLRTMVSASNEELVTRARVLLEAEKSVPFACAVRPVGDDRRSNIARCYGCGQAGHLKWNCPSRPQRRPRQARCVWCGEDGHVASSCKKFPGNGLGVAVASVDSTAAQQQ